MAKKRKKLSKAGKIILDVILVVALCVAGYSSYQLYLGFQEYHESTEAYADLKTQAEQSAANKPVTGETSEVTDSRRTKIDFEYLHSINEDFGGWIELPDSRIDYPFVYAKDNEYYLNHLFNGVYNRSGSIFVDADNQPEFEDKLTLMYAHHMRNGSMFADVEKYKNPDYYSTHKVMYITTDEHKYEFYPVAGYVTNGSAGYARVRFADDEEYFDFVSNLISRSDFVSDETITIEDRTLILSTCSYDVSDGRYILIGKLVRTE
jgi:sortase B